MQDFFKVFFINLISDIDNLLILGTILQRYSYLNITVPAVIALTFSRTIYIFLISRISNLPMVHLLIGVLLLFVALKLVKTSIRNDDYSRPSNNSLYLKIKALIILVSTDFLICLDSVIVISQISKNMKLVTLAIFCSLLISILFLPLIINLARTFFWINIIAGGFIAQYAVVGMLKDPWLADWITSINKIFPGANIVNLAANGTVIIMVVIGLYSYIKQHRITIHK